MTGRELIIYILANRFEDEPIFKDGRFIGFMTLGDAAAKMDVGVATVFTWVIQGKLPYILIGNTYYIPADCKTPLKGVKDNG